LARWGEKTHILVLCPGKEDCRSSRDEIHRLHALVHGRPTAEAEEELLSVLVLTRADFTLPWAEYDGSPLDRRLAHVAGPRFWFPLGFADPSLWDMSWAQFTSASMSAAAVAIQDGRVVWSGAVEEITSSLLETWLHGINANVSPGLSASM
jgi:hypothetical protein